MAVPNLALLLFYPGQFEQIQCVEFNVKLSMGFRIQMFILFFLHRQSSAKFALIFCRSSEQNADSGAGISSLVINQAFTEINTWPHSIPHGTHSLASDWSVGRNAGL